MSAQRYMGEVDGLIPDDAGGWVTHSDYKESESRRKELAEALAEAIKWIEGAPEETWGIGTSGGGMTHWYIRDEVANNFRLVLSKEPK